MNTPSAISNALTGAVSTPFPAESTVPANWRPTKEEASSIIQAHSRQVEGVDILEFRSKNPRRIILNFTCMSRGAFDRWSWYWPIHILGSDTTYIFLRDDTFRYFLGADDEPYNMRCRRLIERNIADAGLSASRVISVGSSMGGYAAIYYAFWLGLRGAVAVNPQVDRASAQMHQYDLWERKMREAGSRWIDLDRFIFRMPHKPRILLRHGRYPADEAASETLVRALERKRNPYIREFDDNEEHGFHGISRQRLDAIIEYFYKEEV